MSVKYIPSQTTAQIFENNRGNYLSDAWLVGTRRTFHQKSKKNIWRQRLTSVTHHGSYWSFYKTSFEERNDIYICEVIDLGEKVLEKALVKSKWKPEDPDYNHNRKLHRHNDSLLIDAYLINKLKLSDIVRLPVMRWVVQQEFQELFMLKISLQANPGKRAGNCRRESYSDLQLNDFDVQHC
jgi:predicted naringenin-chalcone synthase